MRERRVRVAGGRAGATVGSCPPSVEAYLERMRVVAGHMIGDQSEAEVAEYVATIGAKPRELSGPRGWRYEFAKLPAVARKPG